MDERDHVVFRSAEGVLADVAQSGGTLQRRAQDERRQSPLIDRQLVLHTRGRERRDGAIEQIEVLPGGTVDDDAVAAAESGTLVGYRDRKTVLREIERDLFLVGRRRERRLRVWILMPRQRITGQFEADHAHTVDRGGAANGVHGRVQYLFRAFLRAFDGGVGDAGCEWRRQRHDDEGRDQ